MLGGLLHPEFRPDHLLPFGVFAAVKLAGWAVKLLFSFCYRPDAPEHSGEHTPYLAAHTTLVCPVLSPSLPALKLALYSWVACRPSSILIVASVNEADQIERAVSEALSTYPDGRFVCRIRVLEADPGAGKRDKMMAGVEACEASTGVVVFVDDDVTWPPSMLRWLLKPFERRNVGGVGTSQAMRPLREDGAETSWEVGPASTEPSISMISATSQLSPPTEPAPSSLLPRLHPGPRRHAPHTALHRRRREPGERLEQAS